MRLESLREGVGRQLAAEKIGPQRRRAALQHLMISRHAEGAFVHEQVLAGERGVAGGHEYQPRGVVREDDGFFRRHGLGELTGEAAQRGTILGLDGREIAEEQRCGHAERCDEDHAHDGGIGQLANAFRTFPGIGFFLAENEEQIAAEVADAQCAEIIERQERQAVAQRARTEHGVERDGGAGHQKHGVDDVEHDRGDAVAQRVGIAERGGPADAHHEQWQDRGQRQQQRAALGILQQEIFLRSEFHPQRLPEAGGGVGSAAGDPRQHDVKRKPEGREERQAQQQRTIEQSHSFDPKQRDGEEREKAEHRPVVGHGDGGEECEGVEPAVVARGAVFEEAQHHGGEQEQVEHFAGGGGGVFPEGLFETTRERGQEDRRPGPAGGEQTARVAVEPALFLRAIVGQQRDGAGENAQRGRGADGGEEVHRQRLRAGRQPADGIGEDQEDGGLERGRPPIPASDFRHQAEAGEGDPVVQGREEEHQAGEGQQPRELGGGECRIRRIGH